MHRSRIVYIYICMSTRKSKDQTLHMGSRESFRWIILKAILCLVLDLDFQGSIIINDTSIKSTSIKKNINYINLYYVNWTNTKVETPQGCGKTRFCTFYFHLNPAKGPMEWAIKLSLPKAVPGHQSQMKLPTSTSFTATTLGISKTLDFLECICFTDSSNLAYTINKTTKKCFQFHSTSSQFLFGGNHLLRQADSHLLEITLSIVLQGLQIS